MLKPTLKKSIRSYNRIAKSYEKEHGEIYNIYEQNRLRKDLVKAINSISTNSKIKKAIDFGCGAGNLTKHLSEVGCDVLACDVSQGFLDLVSSRTYNSKVEVILINGKDISNIEDESVDIVALYSVLHHIPDYLGILKEFTRVLKRGGIIYIDHESSEEYWIKETYFQIFKDEMNKKCKPELEKYFVINNYIDWFIRKFIFKRYRREGDIHVFEDDHIEWGKIIDTLLNEGCSIIAQKEYLLFKRNYNVDVYNKYKNNLRDMQLIIAQKL